MDIWGLLFALLVRSFLFQPFTTPSGSMLPTLEVGDEFVVAKYAYGYSVSSLPDFLARALVFLPEGRLFGFAPKRGDVVVFRDPRDPSVDFVKRVVGVPGDHVRMIAGRLWINGAMVEREAIAPLRIGGDVGKPLEVARYVETLPGGARHEMIEIGNRISFLADTPMFDIPPDQYFVMGDNRDNSLDSRTPLDKGGIGLVPRDALIGRAALVLLSTDPVHAGLRLLRRIE